MLTDLLQRDERGIRQAVRVGGVHRQYEPASIRERDVFGLYRGVAGVHGRRDAGAVGERYGAADGDGCAVERDEQGDRVDVERQQHRHGGGDRPGLRA